MTDLNQLDDLLRAEPGDAGCDAGTPIMDQYVEIELRGGDPSERFPGRPFICACAEGVARIMTGYSRPPGASATSIRSSSKTQSLKGTHLADGAARRRPWLRPLECPQTRVRRSEPSACSLLPAGEEAGP